MVVGSPLSSSPGSPCRRLGQRRRDLASFGPIAGTDGLVTLPDVPRGGWACVHRERSRGADEATSFPRRFGEGLGVAEALRGFSQPQPRTADDALRPRTKGGGDIRAVASNDARSLLGRIRLADCPRGCSAKGTTSFGTPPSFDNDGHFLESAPLSKYLLLVHFSTVFSCSQLL